MHTRLATLSKLSLPIAYFVLSCIWLVLWLRAVPYTYEAFSYLPYLLKLLHCLFLCLLSIQTAYLVSCQFFYSSRSGDHRGKVWVVLKRCDTEKKVTSRKRIKPMPKSERIRQIAKASVERHIEANKGITQFSDCGHLII
jgi:hypothetical protein